MESREHHQRQSSRWIPSNSRAAGTPGTDAREETGCVSPAESKASQEENWGALSNLRVASEYPPRYDDHFQQQRHQKQGDDDGNDGDEEESKASVQHDSDSNATTLGGPDDRVSKSSLSFILDDYINESSAASSIFSDSDYEAPSSSTHHQSENASRSTSAATATAAATRSGKAGSKTLDAPRRRGKQQGDPKRKARRPPSRICKHEGCEQYVVDQGLCVRHGVWSSKQGIRCAKLLELFTNSVCASRAASDARQKAVRVAPSTKADAGGMVPSCINRAKSRGYCWSHGGGTKCKTDSCEKIAISNGLCWAHGGGKRCIVKGCMRQAYERTNNYCNNHFQELHGDATASAFVDDEMTEEEKESGKREW
ncbi:hypothetical protein FI667_g10712, partial [Globisporangium splendens]